MHHPVPDSGYIQVVAKFSERGEPRIKRLGVPLLMELHFGAIAEGEGGSIQ